MIVNNIIKYLSVLSALLFVCNNVGFSASQSNQANSTHVSQENKQTEIVNNCTSTKSQENKTTETFNNDNSTKSQAKME